MEQQTIELLCLDGSNNTHINALDIFEQMNEQTSEQANEMA